MLAARNAFSSALCVARKDLEVKNTSLYGLNPELENGMKLTFTPASWAWYASFVAQPCWTRAGFLRNAAIEPSYACVEKLIPSSFLIQAGASCPVWVTQVFPAICLKLVMPVEEWTITPT